jgi:hypothetical protein
VCSVKLLLPRSSLNIVRVYDWLIKEQSNVIIVAVFVVLLFSIKTRANFDQVRHYKVNLTCIFCRQNGRNSARIRFYLKIVCGGLAH